MTERGAWVTAEDYSAKLLEIALARAADDMRIKYVHANLENLNLLNADSFNIVVSCIVIQGMSDWKCIEYFAPKEHAFGHSQATTRR